LALGWERYVCAAGRVIDMETVGASAPLKELQRKFGFETNKRYLKFPDQADRMPSRSA